MYIYIYIHIYIYTYTVVELRGGQGGLGPPSCLNGPSSTIDF